MKNVSSWLFRFMFLFATQQIFGNHLTGGELSCYCSSTPGLYNIKLALFRDCYSTQPGGCNVSCSIPYCQESVTVTGTDNACNGFLQTVSLSLFSVTDAEPILSCPSAKNICVNMGCSAGGSFTPGIEKWVFTGTINLGTGLGIPATCCNIKISFTENFRNTPWTSTGAIYLEAYLNRCLSNSILCNGGFEFKNDPFVVFCGTQPFIYNNGVIDPNHDSLSYSLIPGYSDATTPVSPPAPYTYLAPFPFYGSSPTQSFPLGFHLDSITGDIMFVPATTNFTSILAVKIKRWKNINGVPTLLSSMIRDLTIYVTSCPPDNVPTLLTAPPSPLSANMSNQSWVTVPKKILCFDIIGLDTDATDTTYLSWNGALAGATLTSNYNGSLRTTNGPREDTKKFCWTPDSSKISNVPWFFSVACRDNRCPLPGRISSSFSVKVVPDFNVNINKAKTRCNDIQLSASIVTSNQTLSNAFWEISNVPGDNSFTSTINFTSITSPYFHLTQKGNYLVRLTATSSTGYSNKFIDTIRIDTSSVSVIVPDTGFCAGSSVVLNYQAHDGFAPYEYRWFLHPDTSGTVINSNIYSNQFTFSPTTTTKYILQVRDNIGCRGYVNPLTITNNPLPILTRPQPVQICKSTKLQLLDTFTTNPSGGVGVWSYPSAPGAITGSGINTMVRTDSLKNLPYDSILYATGNTNYIKFSYTSPGNVGCSKIDSAAVMIYGLPPISITSDVNWCRGGGAFKLQTDVSRAAPYNAWNFTPYDASGVKSVWTGNGVNKISTGASTYKYEFDPLKSDVVLSPSKNTLTYAYTKTYAFTNSPACTNHMNVNFGVSAGALPIVNAGVDMAHCNTDPTFNLTTESGASTTGGGAYWSYVQVSPLNGIDLALKDSQNFDPTKISIPTTQNPPQLTFKLVYSDNSTGCTARDSALITIVKLPTVLLTFDDSTSTNNKHLLNVCRNTGYVFLTPTATPAGGTASHVTIPITGALSDYGVTGKLALNTLDPGIVAGNYTIVYKYGFLIPNTTKQCKNSDTTTILITDSPGIHITTRNLIRSAYQSEFELSLIQPASPYTFKWTHNGSGYWKNGIDNSQDVIYVRDSLNDISRDSIMIKASTIKINNCAATSDSTYIYFNALGIEESKTFEHFNVFPNPSKGMVNVTFTTDEKRIYLEYFDATGRMIKSCTCGNEQHEFTNSTDLGYWGKGLYLLKITSGDQTKMVKVMLEGE